VQSDRTFIDVNVIGVLSSAIDACKREPWAN
jgi:hypothetical protein